MNSQALNVSVSHKVHIFTTIYFIETIQELCSFGNNFHLLFDHA
jgi:hypothetical protein